LRHQLSREFDVVKIPFDADEQPRSVPVVGVLNLGEVDVNPDKVGIFGSESTVLPKQKGVFCAFQAKVNAARGNRQRKSSGIDDLELNSKAVARWPVLVVPTLPVRMVYPLLHMSFLQSNAIPGSLGSATAFQGLPSEKTKGRNAKYTEPPLRQCVPVWKLCLGAACLWSGCLLAYIWKDNTCRALISLFLLGEAGTLIFLTGETNCPCDYGNSGYCQADQGHGENVSQKVFTLGQVIESITKTNLLSIWISQKNAELRLPVIAENVVVPQYPEIVQEERPFLMSWYSAINSLPPCI
jgi:hypothetical protein